jgi:trk system potassium uptake protein TrkA
MKVKRVLVVGVGRFGTALIETLWRGRAEVVAVDTKAAAVDSVKDRSSHAFVGDATDTKVLEGLGAADFDAVVITFGMAFESTVLCVATLKRLGARYVLARAETPRQAEILLAVGARRVLQIEAEMGGRLGRELLSPVESDLLALADEYRVVPWTAEGPLVGKSLADAQLRRDYDLTVLGYRAARVDGSGPAPLTVARPDYVIARGDTLLLVGEEPRLERFFREAGAPPA